MIGNSGVGKTSIIRSIADKLNKVVYRTSANSLTESGYVGNSVDDILKGLVEKCEGDIEKASNAIVILDEFDKIAFDKGGEIATEAVQNELLTLLEDGEYYLNFRNPLTSNVTISTKNITFICLGVFENLQKTNSRKIGFETAENNQTINNITADDIIKYGFLPEIVGRLPIIIELNTLTKSDLLSILKSPKGYLAKCIELIKGEGIKIDITDDAYNQMIELAENKTGARELQTIVTRTFFKIFESISKNPNYYEYIRITKETVLNPNKFYYETKQNKVKVLQLESDG